MNEAINSEIKQAIEKHLPQVHADSLGEYFEKANDTKEMLTKANQHIAKQEQELKAKDAEIERLRAIRDEQRKQITKNGDLVKKEQELDKRALALDKHILEIRLECERDKNAHLYNFTELVVQKEKKKIWYETYSKNCNKSVPYQDQYNCTQYNNTDINENITVARQERDEDELPPDTYNPSQNGY